MKRRSVTLLLLAFAIGAAFFIYAYISIGMPSFVWFYPINFFGAGLLLAATVGLTIYKKYKLSFSMAATMLLIAIFPLKPLLFDQLIAYGVPALTIFLLVSELMGRGLTSFFGLALLSALTAYTFTQVVAPYLVALYMLTLPDFRTSMLVLPGIEVLLVLMITLPVPLAALFLVWSRLTNQSTRTQKSCAGV